MTRSIKIPRKLDSIFGSIRRKFAVAFSKIRKAIKASPPPLEELKLFLEDGYSHLQSEIDNTKCIDEILTVVRNHCTLININCLEGIVERFDVKEAETYIQTYKDDVQSFCEKTKASLCLGEMFKVTRTSSLLKCETAMFVLDWDPTAYTLQDIRDIIAESVEENVQICVIRKGNSIVVTCYFPFTLTMPLIAKAQDTLEKMKKKGLIQLTVGYCSIYNKHQRDKVSSIRQQLLHVLFINLKEVIAIVEENVKLRSHLEQVQTIRKKMTMQMSSFVRESEGILCISTVLIYSCLLYDIYLTYTVMLLCIEMRKMKEKKIEDLTSLVKTKEGDQTKSSAFTNPILSAFYIMYLHSIFFLFYIKLLRRMYCQCLLRDKKS